MKWKASDYNSPFKHWTPPELLYPCEPSEKDVLHALKSAFQPLPPYASLENQAREQNTRVTLDIPLPDGQIAFLENTAEKCTSPQTKHSQAGMQGAKHWVQRVDTPEGVFRRLTDGYGISLMFGERCHQYIRNSNNWRGISGCLLDVDLFEDDKNPEAPPPVYSMQALFDRYPLLPRICRFILPSASSLHEGRPFKARGVVLFPEPVTDQRVFRAFGDLLLSELNCIPANVTKNPVAVGFGNTHNAKAAVFNDATDTAWIDGTLEQAKSTVLSIAKQHKRQQKQKAKFNEHYRQQRTGPGEGENISEFIAKCDPVAEMIRAGLLTPGRGNEYRWHESEHDRSCEIFGDGIIHIFSSSMSAASPAAELKPVNAHRFYLYQLTGLDLAKDSDKAKCREYLFDHGYGSDPKEFAKKQHKHGIRKPVRLQKNVVSMLTETLQKSREFLKSVFENKKIKFFGLRADTGVGKNEAAISLFLRGFSGLVNVPTTDLAKEIEARLNAAEVNGVLRYRGILSNPDGAFPDENPCIHALRYDAIASRGWNAYELLCEGCEVRGLCEERGYRSQAEQAKQAQVTVMPFPDIFLNPAFRAVAKDYLPTYHDDLILHDEFDPFNFLGINLPKSRLVQMRDDWDGYEPSQFAKNILHILEVDGELSQLRSLVLGMTDAERESIIEGLTCVMWHGQILSSDEAHRCHDFRSASRSLDTIGNLPRLETEYWNLIVQLELFFERYERDADMPMTYENDTLTFYLPPLPMPTRARMGFMSATLNETMFRRAMDSRQIKRGDVSFHDVGLTEWHPEVSVYQLRTNRNPRATAYTPKGVRVDGDLLSPTGEFYFGLVSEDLKNPNRGLITYKALLEEKVSELEGIPTANFGGLVGLDMHFKDVEVIHVLFSPELPLSAVEFKAKIMFGNHDTEPLCYDRDENGHFLDTRLQACYDSGVIDELLQAIGRGRLVSRHVIIVVWCSHYLPGVTDRSQCFLFDEIDWEQADGDFERLQAVVSEREAAESSGDATAYAEATGQSERTAYRQTAEKRKQSKNERNAEIVRLHNEGWNQADIVVYISKHLGKINKSTVSRVIKKLQN